MPGKNYHELGETGIETNIEDIRTYMYTGYTLYNCDFCPQTFTDR